MKEPAFSEFWSSSAADVLAALASTPSGLSTSAAHMRVQSARGLPLHHRRTELTLLFRQFANPITFILLVATMISALLGDTTDAAIITTIILLSGLLSFWQEHSASRAIEDLLAAVQVTVEVQRDGVRRFVPSTDIVPGDIIFLNTGDLIPGDCLLLETDDLLVDEAPLTGESYPVEKAPGVLPHQTPLARRSNSLFMGTHVVRGSATAIVVQVGPATEYGHVAGELAQRPPVTSFEQGLRKFGTLLLRIMLLLVVLIFAANLLLHRPVVESFLFSVAMAVGLTPQLLPAIVSVSLSIGARRMARAKVIVKRLSAIEELGSMDDLCTDKTGTLTVGMVRFGGAVDLDGKPSGAVLNDAYLNAFYQSGYANPIDDAIVHAGHVDTTGTERLQELPYDFQRKRLSVIVATNGACVLISKGAVESVLSVCTEAELPGARVVPIELVTDLIHDRFVALSEQGYRVLAVARREVAESATLAPEDEAGLTFLGFLTFLDPPKPRVARTVRELRALGITVRMVTGDNRWAAAFVARAVGLDYRRVLTGSDVAGMSDERLAQESDAVAVFAEVDPVQKERIVRILRESGRTVGYLGDGINDAPALHAADVGISVDTAVDVAKDAANIVLLEKDLRVLMEGVQLGRQTFANTLKYVFVTISANFGNMASMAAATLFLPFLPLLPLQILLLNFLSDLPATTIATDRVDSEQLSRPGAWDIHFIRDFMLRFGIISSAFDILTFATLRLAFDAGPDLFRSGWFLESMATELAVMLVLRTRRPFYRSRPGILLLISSMLVGIVTVSLPFSPLAEELGLVALPAPVLGALAAVTAGYVAVTEAAKSRVYPRTVARGSGRAA